jgi:hypothetical protein
MPDMIWVATWITIISFILAVPIAVIANLLTPRLEAWWARRNEASRSRRIVSLEDRSRMLQEAIEPESRQEQLVSALRSAANTAILASYGLFPASLGTVMIAAKLKGVEPFPGTWNIYQGVISSEQGFALLFVMIGVAWVCTVILLFRTRYFLRLASRSYLESRLDAVHRELDRLRKLA